MSLPPLLTLVRIARPGRRGFGLWVPVFLLWPLLFVIGLLALAAAAHADAVLLVSGQTYHHYTRLVAGSFALLGETRGTTVRVAGPDTNIHIEIR
ncbi:MAG: hypothetical protein ACYCX3_11845 [Thermoleophilia bacterium]